MIAEQPDFHFVNTLFGSSTQRLAEQYNKDCAHQAPGIDLWTQLSG